MNAMRVKAFSLLVLALCSVAPLPGIAGGLSVPNGNDSIEGNDYSYLPFLGQNLRYQQVYDASQFAKMPAGGAYLTHVFLRPDCNFHFGGVTYTNLQVNLSTTSKAPDQLSSVFSENVGADETVVFGPGAFNYGEGGGGGTNCPRPVSLNYIPLDTPFFYNPAAGNLLMNVRVNGATYINPGGLALDAVNTPGDSVSRAYAASSDATVATQIDTIGFVTGFVFYPVPSLTNSLMTNAVVLTWPTKPNAFVLEWASALGTNPSWQLYPTNQFESNEGYHTLTLSRDSLDQAMYFRLAWTNGPAIPQQSGGSTNGPSP
jgi:hypothetical protein